MTSQVILVLPIRQYCSFLKTCNPFKDEEHCEIIRTGRTYLKEVSPPPVKKQDKTSVEVAIDILSILDIVEVDYQISLQLDLSLTWFDRRLTMVGLHDEEDLNTLTEDFKDKIWLPQANT